MNNIFPHTELDDIGRQYGTDKSGRHHDYLRFYEFFMRPFKDVEFVLLELGVGPQRNKGKSLLTWRDYFPRARIVGVDIRPDAKDVECERVSVEIGNCAEPAFLRELSEKYKPAIIIDDASHVWSHQILALNVLLPALEPGGLFIVEDLGTSFGPMRRRAYADQTEDAFAYLVDLTHLVTGSGRRHPGAGTALENPTSNALAREIDSIAFYKGTALIVKRSEILQFNPARGSI